MKCWWTRRPGPSGQRRAGDGTVGRVSNTGDRPIQVGSHFHFFEVNSALHFDRAAAYGMRLNIACRHGRALRARRRQRGDAGGVGWHAHDVRAQRRVNGALTTKPCAGSSPGVGEKGATHDEPADSSLRLCQPLRPDHRRPRAPGRYRPDHRGRARLHRLRRRDHLWRRQGDPRRHGAEQRRRAQG